MTSIAAFFRKTPVNRLKDYFTQYSSLPPIDWRRLIPLTQVALYVVF